MSNTIVTDINSQMYANIAALATGVDPVRELAPSGDFSKALDNASEKVKPVEAVNEPVKTSSTSVDKRSSGKINDQSEAATSRMDNSSDKKEIAKSSLEGADKVKDKIKETFGLSDEELEAAMQEVGMSLQDLLNPDKLSQLLMNVSGAEDGISLITNAESYANVKSVMDFAAAQVGELKSEFSITDEEIMNVIGDKELFDGLKSELDFSEEMNLAEGVVSDIKSAAIETGMTEAGEDTLESLENLENEGNLQAGVVTDDKQGNKVTSESEVARNLEANQKTEDTEDAELGKTESFKEVKESESTRDRHPLSDSARVGRFEKNSTASQMSNQVTGEGSSFSQTVTTQTQVNTVGDIVETVTSYASLDGEEIASQVARTIRANITAESASLEMQLHPASLGTVNMQVSSANGVVTASLIVESEAVKAALESQLMTLQESFEAQGQKVDAVEVTVATYDMNQNSGRDNGQNEAEKREKEGFRVSGMRRRINLNDFADSAEEELSEDEKITRDMMERDGNQVDYKA